MILLQVVLSQVINKTKIRYEESMFVVVSCIGNMGAVNPCSWWQRRSNNSSFAQLLKINGCSKRYIYIFFSSLYGSYYFRHN